MAFAPNVLFLCLGLFVAGFGAAAVWVPAPGIAAALVGAKRGGMAIGLVGSGIGTGILVAGPLTNSVRAVTNDEGAWRPVYAIQAGIAIFVLIGLFAVLRVGVKGEVGEKVAISVLTTVPNWKWYLHRSLFLELLTLCIFTFYQRSYCPMGGVRSRQLWCFRCWDCQASLAVWCLVEYLIIILDG